MRPVSFVVLLVLVCPWRQGAAQETYHPAGTKVVASPSSGWEACTVVQPMPQSRAYSLKCRTGEFIVPVNRVELATEENLQRTLPPSAASGMPKVGDAVMASPLGLDNDWRRCVVTQDLTYQNAYGVRCGTNDWIVVMKWVRRMTAAEMQAPAPVPPAATPTPRPKPAPAPTPTAAPAPAPSAPIPPGTNRLIPDGVYLAPVGGAIEVLQILGGRMALNPRVFLTSATFTAENAALVGPMQVAGNTLTVEWPGRSRRSGAFRMDGGCLSWGYLYCRAQPFGRGDRLDGDYLGAATAGGGVVSRTATMTFRADGSYQFSATAAIGAPVGTTGAAAATTNDAGRYEIDGWTLRLRSATGQTREFLAFPYDIYGRFDPIYFDGGMMRKRR